jgi:hypothetical protein
LTSAWRSGCRRVLAAPGVAAGAFALTFLLALPLAITMRGLLQTHLGSSLVASSVAGGVNYDWWQEFTSQATGLGRTFSPTIIGVATTLDSVSGILDGRGRTALVAGALALYLAGWTLLAGGVIDRYARQRPTGAHGFFAACGFNAFRLLRLGAVSGIVYWWLFAYVHPWLFDEWYVDQTRGSSIERNVILVRVALYAGFGLVLVFASLIFDYARIRLVVEDRRSAIGALAAAMRFISRHPGSTIGLYALNGVTFLALIAVWALVAPGAGFSIWLVFPAGQLYVLARLLLKLQFLASQTSLFQSRLAHAAYTAAPAPRWPESPAAEIIAPGPPGPSSVLSERRDRIDMSGA